MAASALEGRVAPSTYSTPMDLPSGAYSRPSAKPCRAARVRVFAFASGVAVRICGLPAQSARMARVLLSGDQLSPETSPLPSVQTGTVCPASGLPTGTRVSLPFASMAKSLPSGDSATVSICLVSRSSVSRVAVDVPCCAQAAKGRKRTPDAKVRTGRMPCILAVAPVCARQIPSAMSMLTGTALLATLRRFCQSLLYC